MSGRAWELPGLTAPGWPDITGSHGSLVHTGDGRDLIDLSAGFGSAILGHGAIHAAALAELTDDDGIAGPGLGDIASHPLRDRAEQRLLELVAGPWGRDDLAAIIHHSGSEAVETALKTAIRATGRSEVVAFQGGYHGTFGLALGATWGSRFRDAAGAWLPGPVRFEPWGAVPQLGPDTACVIVEPIQGRAGARMPPPGFLGGLRRACDAAGALLVVDAVFVGANRAGEIAFGAGCDPDVLCLGKALGGGLPASAVVSRGDVAHAAWGDDPGEARHTSTHLASPVACAALLATTDALSVALEAGEVSAAHSRITAWAKSLSTACGPGYSARGTGAMWVLETGRPGHGVTLSSSLLSAGVLAIPAAHNGSCIALTPSLRISDDELAMAGEAITAAAALGTAGDGQ